MSSLGIIVYAAKTKKWFFGRQYQSHIQKITDKVNKALEDVMGETVTDTLSLARDGNTRKLFVAYALGEDTRKYIAEFQNKQMGMAYASKILIVDQKGKILLSTLDQESETKKVSQEFLQVLKEHFIIHKNRPYILFKSDKKEFIVSERFPEEADAADNLGYVLVFYNTQKILSALPDISLAGTKNNQIFLTSKKYSDQQVTAVMNRLSTQPAGTHNKEKDFLVRLRINGIVAAFDLNSQPYRPWLAVLMVLLNLSLLGLVIFTLINAYKTETVPQTFTPDPEFMAIDNPDRYSVDPIENTKAYYAQPEKYEIKNLVNDIEQGKSYSRQNGSQGIEDMIMNSDQDFTSMPDMFLDDELSGTDKPTQDNILDEDFIPADSSFEFDGIDDEDEIGLDDFKQEIGQESDIEDQFSSENSDNEEIAGGFDFDSVDTDAALGLESGSGEMDFGDIEDDELSLNRNLESTEMELPDLDSLDSETAAFNEELSREEEFEEVGIEDSGLSMDDAMPGLTDFDSLDEELNGNPENIDDLQNASFEDSSDIWDMDPLDSDKGLEDIESEFDKAFEQELGLVKQSNDEVIMESLESDVFADDDIQEKRDHLWETPTDNDELKVAAQTYDELDLPEGGDEAIELDEFPVHYDTPDISETDNETALFAQQDRILQGVDESPFDENGLGPVIVKPSSQDSTDELLESPFDLEEVEENDFNVTEASGMEEEIPMSGDVFDSISDEILETESVELPQFEDNVIASEKELEDISSTIADEISSLDESDLLQDLDNTFESESSETGFAEQSSEEDSALSELEDMDNIEDIDMTEIMNGLENDIVEVGEVSEESLLEKESYDVTGEELINDKPETLIEDISGLDLDIPDDLSSIDEITESELSDLDLPEISEFSDGDSDEIMEISSPPEDLESDDMIQSLAIDDDELPDLEDIPEIMDLDEEMTLIDTSEQEDEVQDILSDEDSAVIDDLDIDSLISSVPEIRGEAEDDEEISLSMEELSNLTEDEALSESEDLSENNIDLDELISSVPEVVGMSEDAEDISLSMEELSDLDVSGEMGTIQTDELMDIDEIELSDDFNLDISETIDAQDTLEASEDSLKNPGGDNTESTLEDLDIDNLVSSISNPAPIDEDEDISLQLEDLDSLDLDSEEDSTSNQDLDELTENLEGSEFSEINFSDIFNEPPVKLSTISSVEEYANVAQDLAKNSLKMSKVAVLKKEGETFNPVLNDGFSENISFSLNDPLLERFINNKKSIDIRGELSNTRYLKERMSVEDLSQLAELLVVPIISDKEVNGIALFGRNKGDVEPTNFQKSELHNLGFLQEI